MTGSIFSPLESILHNIFAVLSTPALSTLQHVKYIYIYVLCRREEESREESWKYAEITLIDTEIP